MDQSKYFMNAVFTLLFIFVCFTISLLFFYGPAIVVYYILERMGLVRRGIAFDLALSWDMCSNVLVGGDEQVRVSDRIYYWATAGCQVAVHMRSIVDIIFLPFSGPDHCKNSFYSNSVCRSGELTPRPFPLFDNTHNH
jgi:hypothetical protein